MSLDAFRRLLQQATLGAITVTVLPDHPVKEGRTWILISMEREGKAPAQVRHVVYDKDLATETGRWRCHAAFCDALWRLEQDEVRVALEPWRKGA